MGGVVTSSYAVAGVGDGVSLAALRTRAIRYWLALVGLLSIALIYVNPAMIGALTAPSMPAPAVALPQLDVVAATFPALRVPKLHVAARPAPLKLPSALAVAAAQRQATHKVARNHPVHVPVVTTSYATAGSPVSPKTKTTSKASDPFAKVAVVTDTSGAPPTLPSTSTDSTPAVIADGVGASVAPAATSAATPAVTTPDDPPLGLPTAAVATNPVATAPATTDTTTPVTSADTTTTAVYNSTFTSPPATTGPDATPPPADPPAPAADPTPPATTGPGATPPPADPPAASDPATTTPPVTPPPAASVWQVGVAGSGTHSIVVGLSGGQVNVTIDGTTASRAASAVSGLALAGSAGDDTLTLDASASALSIAFDGGSGVDMVVGPGSDTTWKVTGAGAGSVDQLTFTGVENLVGAADNRDTFVFAPGGTLAGGIDGGAGGYDTLVVDGTRQTVSSNSTGPQSGSVTADGSVINYAGLEPVSVAANDVTINGTSGDDTITVTSTGTSITVSTGHTTTEDTVVTLPVTTTTLTIDGLGGNDSVVFVGTLNFLGATLTVRAESISLPAGASITGTGAILLSAHASNGTSNAPGTLTAQVNVNGQITTTGNLAIEALIDNVVSLTSQTLTGAGTSVTQAFAGTATAEIGAGAVVSAGTISMKAVTTTSLAYAANAPDLTISSALGTSGSLTVTVTNTTHAGIKGGAQVTAGLGALSLTEPASVLIQALDNLTLNAALTDTSDPTKLTTTLTGAFMNFDAIKATVTVSRNTQAYIQDAPLAPNLTLSSGGLVKLDAENTGSVTTSVASTIVGDVENTATLESAKAYVKDALLSVGGLAVTGSNATSYSATGKIARNSVTGDPQATISGSTINAGAQGVSLLASDTATIQSESKDLLLAPKTYLVTLTSTEARNDLTRSTTASATDSTITVAGIGNLTVAAAEAATLVAVDHAASIKSKTACSGGSLSGCLPSSSAKAASASLATNVVLGGTSAFVLRTAVTAHDVNVTATDSQHIDATSELSAVATTDEDAVSFTTFMANGDIALGASLAINTIGWDVSGLDFLHLVLVAVDALIGTSFGATSRPYVVTAYIEDSPLTASGNVSVRATGSEQINSTVTNAATSTQHGIFGAKSTSGDAIVSTNKVNSTVSATLSYTVDHTVSQQAAPLTHGDQVELTNGDVYRYLGSTLAGPVVLASQAYGDPLTWTLVNHPTITGALAVSALNSAEVFSNAKLVASSITTNDGGLHFANTIVSSFLPYDYSTDQGSKSVSFGTKVRIASGFGSPTWTASTGGTHVVSVPNGTAVQLDSAYGTPKLSTASGIRLLSRGDTVQLADDYAHGGTPGAVYDYVGPSGRVDLAAENFGDSARWAKVGGNPGSVYRYVSSTQTLDLDATDYSNGAFWQEIGGNQGAIYEYMGGGLPQTLNLATQNYADLGYWKPVKETTYIPQGINLTESNSTTVGLIVVMNDVRGGVEASIVNAVLRAASVSVSATDSSTIESKADASVKSSGGSSLTGGGTSLAANAVIATNLILDSAKGHIDGSRITTTSGGVAVNATLDGEIDALNATAAASGAKSVGIIIALNTVGWQLTNLGFATLDTILGGTLLGTAQPAEASAYLSNSTVDAAGDISLNASSSAHIEAAVTNTATSAPAAIMGAGGMSVAAVLSSNLVSSLTRAYVDFQGLGFDYTESSTPPLVKIGQRVQVANGDIYELVGAPRGPPLTDSVQHYAINPDWKRINAITAGGAVTVSAQSSASIVATTSMIAEVSPTNDAGAGILNSLAAALLDEYKYTSRSGTQVLAFGDKVRVADDFSDATAAGNTYQYLGIPGPIALGSQDYEDFALWKLLTPSNLIDSNVSYA
ncbi:MAG: Parallel beta-helix repeat, partial [Actinomycetia bacterium]|nr:Parallel beta-helix repeat [Actinomycetes bacterium]